MADKLGETVLNGPDRNEGNTPVNEKWKDMGDYFANVVYAITAQDDGYGIDAFGRSRVSTGGGRSDTEFIYDKQPLLYDDISANGGTATHQAAERDILLKVNGTDNGRVAGMRKHYWAPYTPGRGQLIDITGNLDSANIGGGTCSVFLKSPIVGELEYEQSEWNKNTYAAADWSKSHIFRLDFQSLRVGRIRFVMVIGGPPITLHEIVNDNIREAGYWQYPSLPPYWKLYNSGGITIAEIGYGDEMNAIGFRYKFDGAKASAAMRAICETVISEDGLALLDMPGIENGIMSPVVTPKTISTTLIPVISIRVKSTFNSLANRSLIVPIDYTLITDNPLRFQIVYRPTLTGANWVDVDTTYSGIEYDVTASALSGGYSPIVDFLQSGKNTPSTKKDVLGRIIMSLGSGTADILTLAAIRNSASDALVQGGFHWKEIR